MAMGSSGALMGNALFSLSSASVNSFQSSALLSPVISTGLAPISSTSDADDGEVSDAPLEMVRTTNLILLNFLWCSGVRW